MASFSSKTWMRWTVLLIVWSLSVAHAAANLKRGWIPHDEGALAQSAERVLHGEMPHRDFVDTYTGGLSYLHALSFRLLGVNLSSLRYVLLVFFILWVPAVYEIAREIVDVPAAGALTLLSVAWSVPNYSAGIPSWYSLFFATFGTLGLLKYIRQPAPMWLFLAGFSGGLSFIIKSIALYYMAGALLFFLFREQTLAHNKNPEKASETPLYTSLLTVFLLLFVLSLQRLVHVPGGIAESLNFVMPGGLIALLLLLRERQKSTFNSRQRLTTAMRMIVPFSLGVLVPIAGFFLLYVVAGALPQLSYGIFVLPFKRLHAAYVEPAGPQTLVVSAALTLLICAGGYFRGKLRVAYTLVGLLVAILFAAKIKTHDGMYIVAWHAVKGIIPSLTALAVWRLHQASRGGTALSEEAQQRFFLLVGMMALCSLVQFPFSVAIYFCYIAPLAVLAAGAFTFVFPASPRPLLAVICGFYILFAVLFFRPGFLYEMDTHYERDDQTALLLLPRAGGLRVSPETKAIYEELIPLVQEHAGSTPIWAGPDCPEVYFLSGSKNLTPVLFDFFEEPSTYKENVARLIDAQGIKVVVLNNDPAFSPYYTELLEDSIDSRFPSSRTVGHFEVYWRP